MPPAPPDLDAVFRGARTLVTGGAGFIGSHIAAGLHGLGASVRVLDDLSSGHRENVPEGVDLVEASILDERALADAVAGCGFVFHEAAMVSVAASVAHPGRCMEINVAGTERVLEAARDAGARRVVLASSAAVYGGAPALPSRETDPIDCASPYAASKAADEAIAAAFGRCYDVETVSLRYFNVYGPRQDPDSPYAAVIAAFHRALKEGRTPTVHGTGGQTRDFVFVEDVVRANLLAAAVDPAPVGAAVNVGTGTSLSVREVLDEIARALGGEVEPATGPARAGDVEHSRADITRAREVLGYEPRTDFAAGIRTMI
jgi:UDP-glucose 4-epimerase